MRSFLKSLLNWVPSRLRWKSPELDREAPCTTHSVYVFVSPQQVVPSKAPVERSPRVYFHPCVHSLSYTMDEVPSSKCCSISECAFDTTIHTYSNRHRRTWYPTSSPDLSVGRSVGSLWRKTLDGNRTWYRESFEQSYSPNLYSLLQLSWPYCIQCKAEKPKSHQSIQNLKYDIPNPWYHTWCLLPCPYPNRPLQNPIPSPPSL